jgi:hypothetical protein
MQQSLPAAGIPAARSSTGSNTAAITMTVDKSREDQLEAALHRIINTWLRGARTNKATLDNLEKPMWAAMALLEEDEKQKAHLAWLADPATPLSSKMPFD